MMLASNVSVSTLLLAPCTCVQSITHMCDTHNSSRQVMCATLELVARVAGEHRLVLLAVSVEECITRNTGTYWGA